MGLGLRSRRDDVAPWEVGGGGRGRVPYWTAGDAGLSGLTRAVMVVCLVSAPVSLVMQVRAVPAAQPRPVAALAVDSSAARTAVGELAQAWVVQWLTATQDSAGTLQQRMGSVSVTLPIKPSQVANPQVASVESAGRGVWAAVIGADVMAAGESTAVHRYYQVSVGYRPASTDRGGDPAQLVVLSLPAPVSGPSQLTAPSTSYGQTLPTDGAVGRTVNTFLSSLVAGQGDITRVTSPSAQIHAVTPPLATSVRIQTLACPADAFEVAQAASVQDGTTIHVLVAADLLTADGQARTSQYALTLAARAGRWEVASIDPSPLLAQPITPAPTASASAGANH